MVNSGIFPEFRRRGIYSGLVKATIAYADTHGFLKIISRHVPSNNAVIIPKLRLGFMVSAFEYSEVYGPLVHLTYLIGPNGGNSIRRVPCQLSQALRASRPNRRFRTLQTARQIRSQDVAGDDASSCLNELIAGIKRRRGTGFGSKEYYRQQAATSKKRQL